MKLETIKLTNLTPDPNNARQHDEKNLKAIEGSLSQFGQRKPIVIDKANVIVAGNGTVEAAKRLGWTEIQAVRVPADWDADRIKAFALADNRSAELANWNPEVLTSQLVELEAAGFEIAEFGFEPQESPVDLGSIDEDKIPEDVITRVSSGDIWKLGKHKIICGDSSNAELVKILMDGQTADLVFTDPPYRMESEGGVNQWVGQSMRKVGQAIKDIVDFDPIHFLDSLPLYFSKNMNAYIFCNKDLVPDYLNWAISQKYSFNILFWKKPNATRRVQ